MDRWTCLHCFNRLDLGVDLCPACFPAGTTASFIAPSAETKHANWLESCRENLKADPNFRLADFGPGEYSHEDLLRELAAP